MDIINLFNDFGLLANSKRTLARSILNIATGKPNYDLTDDRLDTDPNYTKAMIDAENSFDERLVLAAWHGQLDRISKLVQEYASRDQGGGEERLPLGTKPVARFGNTTALQKAEALSYTDVVEALQQESKCVIS